MEKIPQREIFSAGHLDDIDDLETHGRDAPLAATEKNEKNLVEISDKILERLRRSSKKAVLFITSPRRRSKETASLLAQEIKKRSVDKIKFRYVNDENLKSTEQGEFILPDGYTAGSFFEGLSIASKIFLTESLDKSSKNLNYRFGDPVIQSDGTYKYPELATYFKKSGETYAQSLIRIFTSVIELSKKLDKLNLSTEVVVIYHGFVFHILKGLHTLAEQVKNKEVDPKPGEIASLLWDIYKNSDNQRAPLYEPLDVTNLENEALIKILIKEVEYLRND